MDETGCSPNRHSSERMQTKYYCTRGVVSQYRAALFKNVHRVTLLPAIFACGGVGTPTFVAHVASVAYGVINVEGAELLESFADFLPSHANITTRRELAGADKFIFERWAKAFFQYCLPLTANARKVLVVYDWYRSHMGLKLLEILREGNIIAYALPAHTSGTTKPLDLHVFRSFKENLNTKIGQTGMHVVNMELDTFDFLRLITSAYATSFTRDNVLKSFAASSISPFNPLAVLNVPRSFSEAQVERVLGVEELSILLEEKREAKRHGMCFQPIVLRRGWVDTSKGLTLTRRDVMELVTAQERKEKAKKVSIGLKEALSNEKEKTRVDKVRKERFLWENRRLEVRVAAYGDTNRMPRPMSVRSAMARSRVIKSRVVVSASPPVNERS